MAGLGKGSISGSDVKLRALVTSLAKLAKHLALIGCLLILGLAGGREAVGQLAIFFIILLAALLHGVGRYLEQRLLRGPSILRHER